MTRLEKCQIAQRLGYKYEPENGKIFGRRGFEVGYLRKEGYIGLYTPNFKHLSAHHYAWFFVYGNVDFEQLDHINQIKTDNRICNLRIASHQLNQFNRKFKGYWFNPERGKFRVQIMLDGKCIHGGYFTNEDDASKRYQELKKIYHK